MSAAQRDRRTDPPQWLAGRARRSQALFTSWLAVLRIAARDPIVVRDQVREPNAVEEQHPTGSATPEPVSRFCELRVLTPPERECPYYRLGPLSAQQQRRALADPRCDDRHAPYYASAFASGVVDDGTALPLLTGAQADDVARARDVLAAGGVVVTDPLAAQARFTRVLRELAPNLIVHVERGGEGTSNPILIVLALAAGVITLGAAGIATGLAAADGRTDLTLLAAVGASPRMRRALALSQSGVIAGLGSLLGMGAGLGAGVAVLTATNRGYANVWPSPEPFPVTVPWTTLGILIVVPIVAMLGAGLLTRSRLPIERRHD